jgi:hypothetical protein
MPRRTSVNSSCRASRGRAARASCSTCEARLVRREP